MKKICSLLMTAALLATFLASCGKEPAATTDASTAATTTVVTTNGLTQGTTVTPPSTNTPAIPLGNNGVDDYTTETIQFVSRDGDWSYKVFSMTYTGVDGDRENAATYDNDTMAEYMAGYNWELGAETLPQGVLDDVKNWDVSKGPFGDNGSYNEQPIGFEGDNHGLMISTTFHIEDLEELKADYNYFNVYSHYDNTFALYVNGTLVYRHFTADTGKPDWTSKVERLNSYYRNISGVYFIGSAALMDLLVEGENTIFVMVKDAWGGRVLVVEADCG